VSRRIYVRPRVYVPLVVVFLIGVAYVTTGLAVSAIRGQIADVAFTVVMLVGNALLLWLVWGRSTIVITPDRLGLVSGTGGGFFKRGWLEWPDIAGFGRDAPIEGFAVASRMVAVLEDGEHVTVGVVPYFALLDSPERLERASKRVLKALKAEYWRHQSAEHD
jgi:hypothetical protein